MLASLALATYAKDELYENVYREHCDQVVIVHSNGKRTTKSINTLFVFKGKEKAIYYYADKRNTTPTGIYEYRNYKYEEYSKPISAKYDFMITSDDELVAVLLYLERDNSYIKLSYTDKDAYFHVDGGIITSF